MGPAKGSSTGVKTGSVRPMERRTRRGRQRRRGSMRVMAAEETGWEVIMGLVIVEERGGGALAGSGYGDGARLASRMTP